MTLAHEATQAHQQAPCRQRSSQWKEINKSILPANLHNPSQRTQATNITIKHKESERSSSEVFAISRLHIGVTHLLTKLHHSPHARRLCKTSLSPTNRPYPMVPSLPTFKTPIPKACSLPEVHSYLESSSLARHRFQAGQTERTKEENKKIYTKKYTPNKKKLPPPPPPNWSCPRPLIYTPHHPSAPNALLISDN